MAIGLHNLGNKNKSKKRVGRGNGSGRGTYSARGMKGQRSRSGGKKGLKYKGLKKTLLGLPKFKGMLPRNAKNQIVLTSLLEKHFEADSQITPGTLKEKRLIDNLSEPVKILFDKEVSKVFEVFDCALSSKAKLTIEKAGGTIVNIAEKESVK